MIYVCVEESCFGGNSATVLWIELDHISSARHLGSSLRSAQGYGLLHYIDDQSRHNQRSVPCHVYIANMYM